MEVQTVNTSICQKGDLVFLSPIIKVKDNGRRIFGEVTIVELDDPIKWKKPISCKNPNFHEAGAIKSIIPVGIHFVVDFENIGQYEVGPIRERC